MGEEPLDLIARHLARLEEIVVDGFEKTATKNDLARVERELRKDLGAVERELRKDLGAVERRLGNIETWIEEGEKRQRQLEPRVARLEQA
ncbi:MAG: hypothetical protein ACREQC_12235 [Candidatus Binataceae bacterium]